MKVFNNEIVISRNEAFSIDKTIENKDGSPYIISSRLNNPHFLISVSTTKYSQKDRYIMNYWLSLDNYPRFLFTQPINLADIKTSAAGTESLYSSFDDLTGSTISGYVDGVLVEYEPGDAVFYIDINGKREYKYYDIVAQKWITYSCKIVKVFTQEHTKEWVEQSYTYSILLVSGESTLSYLRTQCNDKGIAYLDTDTTEQLYEKVKSYLPAEFSLDKPIQYFDNVFPILNPTKLSVLSSIPGGL